MIGGRRVVNARLMVLIALGDAARAERLSRSLPRPTICCRSWPAQRGRRCRGRDDAIADTRAGSSGQAGHAPIPQVLLVRTS